MIEIIKYNVIVEECYAEPFPDAESEVILPDYQVIGVAETISDAKRLFNESHAKDVNGCSYYRVTHIQMMYTNGKTGKRFTSFEGLITGYLVGMFRYYECVGDGETNTEEFPQFFCVLEEEAEKKRQEVQGKVTPRDYCVAYLAPIFSDGTIGKREYLPIEEQKRGEI